MLHIRGLQLPHADDMEQELLGKEYADDIALYIALYVEKGTGREWPWTCFVKPGAHINRHKSSGFCIGIDDVCTWGQGVRFTWLQHY